VHESTIALLGLTPNQAHELNVSLAKFLQRLRAEEVKHAYVKVGTDGSEQIVVEPFERSDVIAALLVEVNDRLGSGITDFVKERLPYDFNLVVGNFEMRTYVEKYADGVEREVFATTQFTKPQPVKIPDVSPRQWVLSPSTIKVRVNSLMRDGHSSRTRHLWSAIDRLPRRGPDANSK
jgi:hypothetical protein